jgi:hypothetical protein
MSDERQAASVAEVAAGLPGASVEYPDWISYTTPAGQVTAIGTANNEWGADIWPSIEAWEINRNIECVAVALAPLTATAAEVIEAIKAIK